MIEDKKYVFLAGGIGITPFRSIIRDLIDRKQKTDIIFLYQAKTQEELLFLDLFATAESQIGIKTNYILRNPPKDWSGDTGSIDREMLLQLIPDFLTRMHYISGPQAFVENYRDLLAELGVPFEQIKTDLFSGYD